MHGYESFAAYATADTMAKTTASVMDLLLKVGEWVVCLRIDVTCVSSEWR